MPSNYIIDTEVTITDSAEPVTLAEAQIFANVTGNNALLESLIIAARVQIENVCGISLVEKDIKVQLRNPSGGIELPFGPVVGAIVFKNNQDEVIEVETVGFGFKKVIDKLDYLYAEYSAGYVTPPEDIKLAIKQQVADWYENRSDDPLQVNRGSLSPMVRSLCNKYSRIPVIL